MKIDGREIAQKILRNLSQRVKKLRKEGTVLRLVIIVIGNNPAWRAYVKQKEIKSREIGIKTTVKHLPEKINQQVLIKTILQLNNDNNVHGIIVQRPFPPHLDGQAISLAITPQKDIDGFHPQSKFQPPLGNAVLRILEEIHASTPGVNAQKPQGFISWLKSQNIVIIGKGETGGKPVIKRLKEMGVQPLIIDSKTSNPELKTQNADIIISCVGKPKVVRPEMIKRGTILISVGLYKDSDGKLHGDYEEEKIKNIASFYTPTPGGVGPVNVACLLENLIKAVNNN